jgi:putative LysE/RhtB family amino acid efflux pump
MSYELLTIFFKGLAVGFVGAIPLGPLGIICVRRTLQSGFFAGVLGGLGTAIADALFGIISAFGLTVIAQFLKDMETPLRIVGGVFMLGMGWHVLVSKPKDYTLSDMSPSSLSHMGNIVSNFFITLTNPLAIVFFTMAFASLGIAENQSFLEGGVVVTGVFLGSMLSWIMLAGFISFKRSAKAPSNMIWMNRIAGTLLLLCGAWALAVLIPML